MGVATNYTSIRYPADQCHIMPVTNKELLNQIHLSGESRCPSFQPHMLKANFCVGCNKLINKHSPEAIPGDEALLKALEYSQKGEKTPSCILPREDGLGGLFHGGFKAVMNVDFLKKEGVTHIVNTAKGLEIFGPKYTSAVEYAKKELKVVFLELKWEDTISYVIQEGDLVQCARFIHQARTSGGSVLVHCAQGKSRSATAVVAYLMAIERGRGFEESLKIVQEHRKMAEPNPTFCKKLKDFACSDALKEIQEELVNV